VTIRRNCPKNVRRVNATTAELGRAWQVVYIQLDPCTATTGSPDLCLALQTRQQGCAAKLDRHRLIQRISDSYGFSFGVPLCESGRERQQAGAKSKNEVLTKAFSNHVGNLLGALDAVNTRIVADAGGEVKTL
jgi:hypothetical protein